MENNNPETTRLNIQLSQETQGKLKSILAEQKDSLEAKGIKKEKEMMSSLVSLGIDLLYGYEELIAEMGRDKFAEILNKKLKTKPQLF